MFIAVTPDIPSWLRTRWRFSNRKISSFWREFHWTGPTKLKLKFWKKMMVIFPNSHPSENHKNNHRKDREIKTLVTSRFPPLEAHKTQSAMLENLLPFKMDLQIQRDKAILLEKNKISWIIQDNLFRQPKMELEENQLKGWSAPYNSSKNFQSTIYWPIRWYLAGISRKKRKNLFMNCRDRA